MCGLSGFSNIPDSFARLRLTLSLGLGIDQRGGHGIGFVGIKDRHIHYCRDKGEWCKAHKDFIIEAALSDTLLMHARWATCGKANEIKQAHPFEIKRQGKSVLYGAHNGIMWDAWDSAKHHKRKIDVDSQELFELIADRELKTLQSLSGYGVAMWVENGKDHINFARLSDQSEICVVEVENKGFVWGSTWSIVADALEDAKLNHVSEHFCDEVGRVYRISKKGVVASKIKGVRFADPWQQYIKGLSEQSEESEIAKQLIGPQKRKR